MFYYGKNHNEKDVRNRLHIRETVLPQWVYGSSEFEDWEIYGEFFKFINSGGFRSIKIKKSDGIWEQWLGSWILNSREEFRVDEKNR